MTRRSTELALFFDEFAYKMRCARKAKRLSRTAAAEAAGVTMHTVRHIEGGKNCYVFSVLLLMEVYGMHPSDIGTVGKRVLKCREAQGKLQQELAEASGVTQNYISKCERGMSYPTIETLFALSKALGVDIWTFLEEHGDEHR